MSIIVSEGLAKAHGSMVTRDKRTEPGVRRFARTIGHASVLRPACSCSDVNPVMQFGDPLLCPDCGGARLTKSEAES